MSFWKKTPPVDPEHAAYKEQLLLAGRTRHPSDLPEWSMIHKHGTIEEASQCIGLLYDYLRTNHK